MNIFFDLSKTLVLSSLAAIPVLLILYFMLKAIYKNKAKPYTEKISLLKWQRIDKEKKYKELCKQQQLWNERAEIVLIKAKKTTKIIRSSIQKIDQQARKAEEYYQQALSQLEEYAKIKCDCYPLIAIARAEHLNIQYERIALDMEIKERPAFSAALQVRLMKNEHYERILALKMLQYETEYMKYYFPDPRVLEQARNEYAVLTKRLAALKETQNKTK